MEHRFQVQAISTLLHRYMFEGLVTLKWSITQIILIFRLKIIFVHQNSCLFVSHQLENYFLKRFTKLKPQPKVNGITQ